MALKTPKRKRSITQLTLHCLIVRLVTGTGRRVGRLERNSGAACTTNAAVKSLPPAYHTIALQLTTTGRRHGLTAKRLTVVTTWAEAVLPQSLLIAVQAVLTAGTSTSKPGAATITVWDVRTQRHHCLTTAKLARPTGRLDGLLARNSGVALNSASAAFQWLPTIARLALTAGWSAGPRRNKSTAVTTFSGDAQPQPRRARCHMTAAQAIRVGRQAGQNRRRPGAVNMLVVLVILMIATRASLTGRRAGPTGSRSGAAHIIIEDVQ